MSVFVFGFWGGLGMGMGMEIRLEGLGGRSSLEGIKW